MSRKSVVASVFVVAIIAVTFFKVMAAEEKAAYPDPRTVAELVMRHPYVTKLDSKQDDDRYLVNRFPALVRQFEKEGDEFFVTMVAFIDKDRNGKVNEGDILIVTLKDDEDSPIDFKGDPTNAAFYLTKDGYDMAYMVGGNPVYLKNFEPAMQPALRFFSIAALEMGELALKTEKEVQEKLKEFLEDLGKPWQEREKNRKRGI